MERVTPTGERLPLWNREQAVANGTLFPLGRFGTYSVLITKRFLCELTKTELAIALLGALHRAQYALGPDRSEFRVGDYCLCVEWTDSCIAILFSEDIPVAGQIKRGR